MTDLYALFAEHSEVTTDSRRIRPGSLFFALRGASFDGNRFAAAALEQGAAYAVVDDPSVVEARPDLRDRFVPVGDVLAALQELAREHRRRLGIPIVGIVGSNGKTTTKELVSRVLAERFRVYATHGNLNNHIGVPLTLLSMTRDVEFGVVEMGASACGEIALLCSISQPDYGIITNIGRSHLEGFGGPEGIRRGKGELFDYLSAHGGRAFVRREDGVLAAMAAEHPAMAAEFYSAELADGVASRLEGEYNRLNIAAAMAVGRFFGVERACAERAVAAYDPDNHRSQRTETARNTLIVDCYNANPSSMAASVDHALHTPLDSRKRRLLVLGDMLELGGWSREEHTKILRQALAGEAELWLVGAHFADAFGALDRSERPAGVRLFASQEELAAELRRHPVADALVLLKGSHSVGLERCIELF